MENLPYLLKATIGIVAFYGFYWLVLRLHTYFVFNRFYLLTVLFLSLVVPLIELPTDPLPVVEVDTNVYKDWPSGVQNLINVQTVEQPVEWLQFLWFLYGIGVLVMVFRFIGQLASIFKIIRKSERFVVDSQTIVLTPDGTVPTFSFFKWLIINPKDYEKYFDTVLRHETIHAQQGHSFDLILTEIVHIVLWFNPVLIYYKRSLRQIHEYLADDQTDTTDRQHYAQKLFGYVFQVEAIPLTNSFLDSSTLKNRIKMLYQKRSSRWVLGRYLVALPLLGLLITLVAARVDEPTEKVAEKVIVKGEVVADTIPNGDKAKNVVVVIETNKSVKTSSIEVPPVPKPLWREDISIKVDSMWIDPSERSNIKKIVISPSNSKMFGNKKPLYVIDGKIIENDTDFDNLKPENIVTMNVLKGEAATKLYGYKAKDGVVVIETKKAQGFMDYKLKADYLDENITYYLVDEKITAEQMKKINPDDIATVDVRKDEKGKNSTVIITLKKKKE
jgi:beta-lactamase regulating signal transducer with metallopeptidase domain